MAASASEIAQALTEALIAKADPNILRGNDVGAGQAEKFGEKIAELYKGILLGVVAALTEADKRLKGQ